MMEDLPLPGMPIGDPFAPPASLNPAGQVVTEQCDICGEDVTGNAKGRGSIAWAMGRHKFSKHDVRSPKSKRARPGAPTAADFEDRPALSVVRDTVAEIPTRTGPPSATDLGNAFGRGLTLLSIGAARLAAETDPTIPGGVDGTTEREQLVGYLKIEQRTAQQIMRPVGKALAGTKINKRYGRGVVENIDVIGSLIELGTIGAHWAAYLKMRGQFTRQLAAGNGHAPGMMGPAGPLPAPSFVGPQSMGVHPLDPDGHPPGWTPSAEDVAAYQRTMGIAQ